MLQLYCGRSGSGKTELIHNLIYNEAGKKDIVLIVPEQSSFHSEKKILNHLGAAKASAVSVTTFKRLCNTLTEVYGGRNTKRIDEGVKTVLMSIAAQEASDHLELYAGRCGRSDFAELMVNAVNEYKMCAITPGMLKNAAGKVENRRLRDKLNESALIYTVYQTLLSDSYSDPDDDLTRLYSMLREHQYFRGKTVFLDSFNGFSGQELKVLECVISQAEDTIVSLCCDESSVGQIENSIFKEPDTSAFTLRRIAEKYSVSIGKTIRLEKQLRFKNPSIAALEESIFRFDGDSYDYDDDSVRLYSADDEYDEVRQAARDICVLVRDHNYSYSDITLVCREPKMYADIIESEFPKYDIPFFMSNPKPLETKPLIRLIMSAFEAVHSSFRTEKVLSFLKTGLTHLSREQICKLENYAYIWNIKGKRWKSPFTMNPDGNKEKLNETELAEIESIRKSVIDPLTEFADVISRNNNGKIISKAVYILLEKFKVPENIRLLAAKLNESGDINAMETEIRIWDMSMIILDRMYTVLGGRQVDSRRYYELLKLMIRKNPVSDIPQTLDQVTIGTAGNIRYDAPKAVIILGAIEGVFPAAAEASGLFSDAERNTLINMELPLYDSLYGMSLKEKFNVYAAISAPSELLYVNCHTSDSKGEECRPSSVFREIGSILKNTVVRSRKDIPDQEFYFTEKQIFEECAANWKKSTPVEQTLKLYFRSSEEFASKYNAVERAVNDEPFSITEKNAKLLFGDQLSVSPSQTEKYYKCPFSYYCEYGLRAYPRVRAEKETNMYGSIVHYVLENMLRNEGFRGIADLDEKGLITLIRKYIQLYIESIGGTEERTSRFMAQFRSMERNVLIVLKRLIEEFSQSRFIPEDFELKIGDGGQIPEYNLLLPDGKKISVMGKVDRVDSYTRNGEKYIRIVDYKTGKKDFRLSDVLYGLNIQMLFYLAAIERNGAQYYNENGKYDIAPAGILYMPSTPESRVGEVHNSEALKQSREEEKNTLRMNGLLIDDRDVIEAMESGIEGIFIPVKLSKKTDDYDKNASVVSMESYGKIFSYIDKKLMEMAVSVFEGRIERYPVRTSGNEYSCKYCAYKNICGFEDGKPYKKVSSYSVDEAVELMEEEMAKHE